LKCLVSGATGFIGRQLCQQLAVSGDSVTALSRSGDTLADGTPSLALDLAVAEPQGDLLRGVDVVFHLAGIAHQRAEAQAYRQVNYLATLKLARMAAAGGVKTFIFVSSVKAMGPALTGQIRSEDDCNPPRDAYGLSKWQAECDLRAEFIGSAMSVIILRPALVYGPRAAGNLGLLYRAAGWSLPCPPAQGERSMLALQDLVDLLCQLAHEPPAGVHTWIACGDRAYSTRAVYQLMRQARGKGRSVAWLPLWGWRLAAAVLDTVAGARGDSTFDKLFGTELYSNAAVKAATTWCPVGKLEDTVAAMSAGGSAAT
jgi:UDP-glucose 4-epimerase